MATDIEDGGVYNWSSAQSLNGAGGSTSYIMSSPWRFIASGSYVIREARDTKQQRGFITADVEYVTYPSGRFSADNNSDEDDDSYYSGLKSVVKDSYKGAFNFRLGGELKLNTLMIRLGGAYYGNPYKDSNLKSSIKQLTGGLGYRNKGIFIDLGYAYTMYNDNDFPYRLQDKSNTFATYKNNRNKVALTFGFKL